MRNARTPKWLRRDRFARQRTNRSHGNALRTVGTDRFGVERGILCVNELLLCAGALQFRTSKCDVLPVSRRKRAARNRYVL